jgi:squalene cyclase
MDRACVIESDLIAVAVALLADPLLGITRAAQVARESSPNAFGPRNTDDLVVRLLAGLRSRQQPSGAWLDAHGQPDLGRTALAWWALAQHGESTAAPHMVAAERVVHELGGAQRGPFELRLLLALAGRGAWSWLPSIPSELWLLPSAAPLSPHRLAPWARSMVHAFHLLAKSVARVHLVDPSRLLLRGHDGRVVEPRIVTAGLPGDVLQAVADGIRWSRRLPRGWLHQRSMRRAELALFSMQQAHGGWFGSIATVFALLAMRARGVHSDDPRIQRGLAYLATAMGQTQHGHLVLADTTLPTLLRARFVAALPELPVRELLADEIGAGGPWQMRADARAGGFELERGAAQILDTRATAEVLATLRHRRALASRDATAARRRGSAEIGAAGLVHTEAWPALRRSVHVLLAMQEPDGSFARFERGEREIPLARLPWRDACRLATLDGDLEDRIERTAVIVRELAAVGWRREDDRVARALAWLEAALDTRLRTLSVEGLAAVAAASAAQLPTDAPLRKRVEQVLRGRQREDGSFGSVVATARALDALLALDGVCVQATRAARYLVQSLEVLDATRGKDLHVQAITGQHPDTPWIDPLGGVRESATVLARYAAEGGAL